VRDKLLGVGSHDVDVAINKLTGENFGLKMLEYLKIPGNDKKHGLEEKESKKIVSGLHTIKANPEASKNLETATIRIMGIDLDLVNLRKETYNEVSRNPEMEFGTAEEDAMRRDATVNAMFYNLNTKQIEDFTGRGFADMDAKIIRTPLEPYQTFKDDPLRVLRLIRFASRLNFTIEPETASAMANQDIQEALKIKIKRERVGIELEKMLKGPDPYMALELINRYVLQHTTDHLLLTYCRRLGLSSTALSSQTQLEKTPHSLRPPISHQPTTSSSPSRRHSEILLQIPLQLSHDSYYETQTRGILPGSAQL